VSSLFLEIPQPYEITSLRGRIRSELIGENGLLRRNEDDTLVEPFPELVVNFSIFVSFNKIL